MDHSHMDHGDHGMPGMDHGNQCNMNMLFTWDYTNLCIVFKGWHINGFASLTFSLLAIILLTAGYEAVREISRRYDLSVKKAAEGRRTGDATSRRYVGTTGEKQTQVIKALLYAVQVFYSFFIMLLFMTYNGWVMLAVAVGAFVGYILFSGSPPTKTAACH